MSGSTKGIVQQEFNTHKKNLNVCFASIDFHPIFSGAGIRFQRYTSGLQLRGINMHFFTSMPTKIDLKAIGHDSLPEFESINGVLVKRVSLPETNRNFRNMIFASALLDHCRNLEIQPDIIQAISVTSAWLPQWYAFRRLGIPIVLTKTMVSQLSSNRWKRYLQLIYWRLPFLLADCVVVSSMKARDAWQNVSTNRRVEVIPNGLDLERFQPVATRKEKQALRQELGLPLDKEHVLFMGGLIERKGIDVLVKAWRFIAYKRPNAYLILVGPNKNDMRSDMQMSDFQTTLESEMLNSGAADRIVQTGKVDDVERYFQAADLFIFPSRREGMGNVVLEAFGCALPVILTPFEGLPDEFGYPDEHYILVERTPQALANVTIELLENQDKRRWLGYNARKWVESHMNVEHSLDKYAALYRELVTH